MKSEEEISAELRSLAIKEMKANIEQLQLIIDQGDISSSDLIANYYKPMSIDGVTYRTHCLMINVRCE